MSTIKFEWRKQEKKFYVPKTHPELIEVPSVKYIMLSGKGNPNDGEFSDLVGVLYSLAYGIKMLPKKGIVPEGCFDYTVYPLEGIWKLENGTNGFDKNNLVYKIMIRQPEFVTGKIFENVMEMVKKSKPHPKLKDVIFDSVEDGLSVHMMHIGSYDNEPASFETMKSFCDTNNLKRADEYHREIYLNDSRKTLTAKLQTVLRYRVIK